MFGKRKTPQANRPQADKVIEFPNAIFMPEVLKIMAEKHTITLPLRGYSMRPFLEDARDKALLRTPGQTKVGDPVLAEIAPRRYVLHRVVRIDGNCLTLRGDGNIGTETCRMEDVRAEVVGFYRKGRDTLDRTDGRKWRAYSWIWTRLLPVRRYLLAAYTKIWMPLFGPM